MSLVAWFVTTFVLIIVDYTKGGFRSVAGLPILSTPTVPIYIYQNALATVKCLLIFDSLDKAKGND
jgi:hypothetical protein